MLQRAVVEGVLEGVGEDENMCIKAWVWVWLGSAKQGAVMWMCAAHGL